MKRATVGSSFDDFLADEGLLAHVEARAIKRVVAWELSEALKRLKPENDDQRHGIEIVRKALGWPTRQIALNAGEDGSIVVGKILDEDNYAYGFDAQAGEYANLISKGIIDPTKVVRSALQDAASVAGLLITTEAMVAELPKKKTPPAPSAGPGAGTGDMDF